MKVLVTYYSETGNTALVAEAIYDEVVSEGHQADLCEVGDLPADALTDHDLVFLGAACHDTDLARPVKDLLARILPAPPFKLAGFATHSSMLPDAGERERQLYDRWASGCPRSFHQASEEKQIDFLGYFGCQGRPSPGIERFIHNTILTDEDEWATYRDEARKHPDDDDLVRARVFAQEVLARC
jgi:flavodoxin